LQKREVCRSCYQTGQRGVLHGINFFYAGSEYWDNDIPKRGEVSKIAGISPIKALIKAVKTKEIIISPILIGAMNKFVKFLLQISSKNNILKPMLVLKRKS